MCLQTLTIITTIISIILASVIPRQAVTQVAQLGGWIECLAVRSNGALFANRLDVPELWTIDPVSKASSRILSFPNALGLTGIAETSPDIFAVVAGNFSTIDFSIGNGSWSVWKVDLSGETPKQTLLKAIPEAGFLLGATRFDNDTAFVADAGNGALYRISISTGDYSIVLQDPSMQAPAGSFISEGIHGVRYSPPLGTVFFTNTFGSTFNRFSVDRATGNATSSVTTVTTSVETPMDLAIVEGTAFIMSLNGGGIFKVTPDGKSAKIVNVMSGSTVAIGRGESDTNLYYATSNGSVMAVSNLLP